MTTRMGARRYRWMAAWWVGWICCWVSTGPAHADTADALASIAADARASMTLAQLPPAGDLPTAPDGAVATSDRAAAQIARAEELLSEHRFTEALQALERALRYSPSSVEAHLLSADIAIQAGHTAQARDHLDRAAELRPRRGDVHYLRGRVALDDQAWTAAAHALRQVALCPEVDPDLTRLSGYHLGAALTEAGFLTAAADCFAQFDRTPAVDPDGRWARDARDVLLAARRRSADLLERLDRPVEAAAWLQRAAELDAGNADLCLRQARLLQRAGDVAGAAAAARRSFEIGGDHLDVLVDIRSTAGQSAALIADLESLARERPDHPGPIAVLTDLYATADPAAGVAFLHELVTQHPTQAAPWTALAQLQSGTGDWPAALTSVGRAIDLAVAPAATTEQWITGCAERGHLESGATELLKNSDLSTYSAAEAYALGRLADRAGRLEQAAGALTAALAKQPAFIDALVGLGEVRLRTGDWREAKQAAARVVDAAQNDARGYRILGLAHLGLDQYEPAAEALILAHHHNRQDTDSLEALIEVYQLSGQPLKARQQYQMILEANPNHARAHEELVLAALAQRNLQQAELHLSALERLDDQQAFVRMRAFITAHLSGEWQAYVTTLEELIETRADNATSRLHLAQVLLSMGEYADAGRHLEAIDASDIHHTDAQLLLARVLARDLDFDGAIRVQRVLLERHPRRVPWREGLARLLIDDHQFKEAGSELTQLLDVADITTEERDRWRYDLLCCMVLGGDPATARSTVETWLAAASDVGQRLQWLQMFLALGADDAGVLVSGAEQQFSSAVGNDRRELLHLLVQAYVLAERATDAEALLLDWLELDPEDPVLTDRLTRVFEGRGHHGAAIELATAALDRPQNEAITRHFEDLLIGLYQEAHRPDDAENLIRRRLAAEMGTEPRPGAAMGDRVATLRAMLVQVLLVAGRRAQALLELDDWQRALIGDTPITEAAGLPALEPIHNLRSLCYALNGQPHLALQEQERRWQCSPHDAGPRNDFGYQLAVAGTRLDEAERLIRHAVAEHPRLAAYLDSMGWVKYRQGEFQSAEEWLDRAARAPMAPWSVWLLNTPARRGADDPVIRDHLGDATYRTGQIDAARAHWQAALALANEQRPDSPLSAELAALLDSIPRKLSALDAGEPPPVAAIP